VTSNLVPLTDPGRTLVCLLPHAGGSVSSYWSWANLFPADVAVSAVQLPGRQDRWQEPPYTDFGTLVSDLADEIADVAEGNPYVLAGHSLGAAIGYEVAREMRARRASAPALLVVSAAPAPYLTTDAVAADQLSDSELIEDIRASGWLPAQVLDSVRTVIRVYDGDHFYLWGREPEVASAILADLRSEATI
jgi:surfactin synthase thioesterase subunit